MKQLRTKVILSAFVLIFALVATIGSTFAWFTVATTVQVDSMQLNVQSQDSLLIRMANNNGSIKNVTGDNNLFDATQYKTTLTTADILNYYFFDGRATAGGSAVPADAWRLEPVTVVNATYTGVNGKEMSTLASGSNVTRTLSATVAGDINSKTGKFIEISFYLFSQGETPRAIVLQDLNITTTMTGVAAQVVDAVRVSVWRAGYQQVFVPAQGETPAIPEAFVSQTNQPSYVFGFTKDYGFQFTSANPTYYHANPSYTEVFDNTDPDNPVLTGYTLAGFNQISDLVRGYNALGDGVTPPNTASWNSLYHNTLAAKAGGTTTIGDAETILTLAKNVPTLVTVRIFVEGWAQYATNNIIASNFSISYKFAIKAAA
jgi:hypothetical protein